MKNASPEETRWSLVREDFPALKRLVYLDSAAWGLQHQRVSSALKQYLDFTTEYGVLSKEHLGFWESGRLSSEAKKEYPAIAIWQGVEAVRKECAAVLGVKKPDAISWHMNTTQAFETVARMVTWEDGDELIATNLEHESILNVCEMLETSRGVQVKQADGRGLLPTSDFESRLINRIRGQISDKTRMIVLSHVFFCCNQVINPSEVVNRLRQDAPTGTLIVLDGAHALGQIPLDLDSYACDAYVTSGSKWLLAPAGSGILYVSAAALDFYQYMVWPLHMYESTPQRNQMFRKGTRLEGSFLGKEITRGATPQLPLIGLHAALKEYQRVTAETVIERIHRLSEIACATLGGMNNLSIESCESTPTGMLFLTCDNWTETEVFELAKKLKDEGICISAIGTPPSLRVSTHYYNEEEDFQQLMRSLYSKGVT